MARPRNPDGVVKISISASVLPEMSEELDAIAIHEERTKSQIIEKLLERGMAAYRMDGKLSEKAKLKAVAIPEKLRKAS